MYNPSYLIQSRHGIYYFRYPIQNNQRVSQSLSTRCPKTALRLARILECGIALLLKQPHIQFMNHTELKGYIKEHMEILFQKIKARMDENGLLDDDIVKCLELDVQEYPSFIASAEDDYDEYMGLIIEGETETDKTLQTIIDKNELNITKDSDDYRKMVTILKYAQLERKKAILEYNASLNNIGLVPSPVYASTATPKKQHALAKVITDYIAEKRKGILEDSVKEIVPCLDYLIEFAGDDFPVANVNSQHAREIKNLLGKTPLRRNIMALTKGRELREQVEIAEHNDMTLLSDRTVNKYLEYYSGLFKWAVRNGYAERNVFEGMAVKLDTSDKKRHPFSDEQVHIILAELENGYRDNSPSKYWGTLLAIYTGARRNEIAGLLPEDIIYSEDHKIWYMKVTDEEESQRLKTKKAKRMIPIHSRLIDLGFLDFIDIAKAYINENPKTEDGKSTRLLYEVTYHTKEKWGRNLGYFVNTTLLEKKLKIKTNKLTLHSLRHSFITNLHQAGISIGHIASMVGHEHGTVTEKVYINWDEGHLPSFKESIEKLIY